MAFFKYKIGMIMFILAYVSMVLQTGAVYLAYDEDISSYLSYHKFFFIIWAIMTLWTHYKCTFTNPGLITHELNPYYVEFYINVHDKAIKRAENFNKTYGRMLFERIDEKDIKENDEEDDYTDWDDFEYPAVTSIVDETVAKVSLEHNVKLKRCDRCYIVRVPGVHHCSRCKG